MDYVVCLAFDPRHEFVTLIEKRRPEWQVGRLNGPGGKMEADEDVLTAASREFHEETGALIPAHRWRHFATARFVVTGAVVHFVTHTGNFNTRTTTDEKVGCYNLVGLHELPVIPNLHWLIPLALDAEAGFVRVGDDSRTED